MSWQRLVCGAERFDLELLKRHTHTSYENADWVGLPIQALLSWLLSLHPYWSILSSHGAALPQVWSMLEHFSEEETTKFLRFVRGITCLPSEELLRRTPFELETVAGGAQSLVVSGCGTPCGNGLFTRGTLLCRR
jgi:hypothetical protein